MSYTRWSPIPISLSLFFAFAPLTTAFADDPTFFSRNNNVPMIEIGSGDAPIEIRMNDGRFQTRYRLQTDNDGTVKTNAIEHQILLDVTVSFFKDKVRLDFEGQNGSSFTGGWGSTGIGTGDPNLAFYMRRLSLTLSPKSGLDFTAGSMKPEWGVGSENSSLDADGYVMGYRSRVALGDGYLSVTTGYVGDLKDPNVFNRLNRLDDFNYLQAIITHSIGEIVRGSLEYTQLAGENFARGALKFDVSKWTSFLDSITVEDTVHVSAENPGNVLATKLSKRFKDVFAGRDLATSLTYIYRTEKGFEVMPLGDKAWDGHSMRVNVAVPNMVGFKNGTQLGAFLDFIQSFSDFDKFRVELGLALKF